MTDTSKEAVERLLNGVTPGPWKFVPNGGRTSITDADYDVLFRASGTCAPYYDASFIAAARDLVPALLARAEAAEARLHEFQAAQGYRYVGRDMKPVLARDLEARAEAAEADLRASKISEVFWRDGWHALDQDKRAVEAKLAIAVEALEKIVNMPDYRLPKPQDNAHAALAHIKGDE